PSPSGNDQALSLGVLSRCRTLGVESRAHRPSIAHVDDLVTPATSCPGGRFRRRQSWIGRPYLDCLFVSSSMSHIVPKNVAMPISAAMPGGEVTRSPPSPPTRRSRTTRRGRLPLRY